VSKCGCILLRSAGGMARGGLRASEEIVPASELKLTGLGVRKD
jgi:hypothetical protein